MAINIVMPALEMAQETGKLVMWLKQDGEAVKKGEPLLEIETDKAVVEVEATADGYLGGILVQAGEVVPVGETIAWILAAGEAVPAVSAAADYSAGDTSAPTVGKTNSPETPVAAVTRSAPKISPKARGLLRQHNIDAANVHGSGPDGIITAEDVMAAVAGQRSAAPTQSTTISSIARLMAERTTESWTTVPHFFLTRDVDASELLVARERRVATFEKQHGVRYTHTDSLVKLAAVTLRQHPRINAS
jgi:pyruvate dehydrogenase E2 component (dihydrolipoamide acetyltransferase)